MILLDGAGDRSYPELNYQTPLQAARTPALDHIAENGANGLYHAALLGQALPSENAHFAMFGYDMDVFPGRGALEALGAGISLDGGEVALLAHFVSVRRSPDATLTLIDGKPQISDDEIQSLIQTVEDYSSDGIRFRFHHTHGFRGILTLAGDVAPFVTDSDPITEGYAMTAVIPWQTFADDPQSQKTSRAVSEYLEWVHHTLTRHPVNRKRRKAGRTLLNGLVTQRAGRLRKAIPFAEINGMRGLSIASGIVYHGLCTYLGMDVRRVTDTTDPGNDLCHRIQMALASLSDYNFIHVHTKMPDEAAHRKDPLYKTRVLEQLDQGIAAVLSRLTSEPETLIVVAADHSTPSAGPLIHSGEAVPLVFHGPGVRRDRIRQYDEVSAAGGALGLVRGKELMYLIINHLDRAKLQGLMDTPVDQAYWPGRTEPFILKNG
ncbi:MAG: alkaline phosphatase family protein [Desulfobacterales bacterium]